MERTKVHSWVRVVYGRTQNHYVPLHVLAGSLRYATANLPQTNKVPNESTKTNNIVVDLPLGAPAACRAVPVPERILSTARHRCADHDRVPSTAASRFHGYKAQTQSEGSNYFILLLQRFLARVLPFSAVQHSL